MQRRLIEKEPQSEPPFVGRYQAGLNDIQAWLRVELDETEFERWLLRFSLFDWDKSSVSALANKLGTAAEPEPDANLALFVLFKPLFDRYRLEDLNATKPAKVGPLRQLAALLLRGDAFGAVQLAHRAYKAFGIALANFAADFAILEGRRLLAALLIPVNRDILNAFHRWRPPTKQNNYE